MRNLLPWRDGRCVQDQVPNSPFRTYKRLLVIQLHVLELQRTIRTKTYF